jgi:hypothetical protein
MCNDLVLPYEDRVVEEIRGVDDQAPRTPVRSDEVDVWKRVREHAGSTELG